MTELNAADAIRAEREPLLTFERLLEVEQGNVQEHYQRFLLALLAVLSWIAALRWTVTNSEPAVGVYWPTLFGLLVTLGISWTLRARVRLSIAVALIGLAGCVALEGWFNPGLLSLLLFAPWIVLVSAVASTAVLAGGALGCAVLIVLLAIRLPDASSVVFPAGLSLFTVTIAAWIASRPIFDSLAMALYSASDAMRARDELRDQRRQLAHTVKMLDEALYRQSRLSTSLILARQQAEEARQLKVRFANMLSHEIRTPLNIIISFSEVMANAPEVYGLHEWPASLRADVNEIYRAGKHLLGLINDVLELAQIEANRVILKKERVSLIEVVEQAVALTHGWFDHAGLYLKMETEGDIPLMLIDRVRIRQVLLNLLSNARHYTAQGGVTVRVARLEDEVVVSVRDTGIGISKDNLHRLFEEFARFGETIDDAASSGLGLAISRLFIQLHGGRMWAESAGVPGLGTTVFFTLPLTPAAVLTDVNQPERDAEYWQSRYDRARAERLVLVVADDPTVVQVAARLLGNHGRVITSSLAGALDVLNQHQPDAVVVLADKRALSDQMTDALRQSGAALIFCALEGAGSSTQSKDALGAPNINGWLVKPITRDDLTAALLSVAPHARLIMSIEDDAQMARFYELALGRDSRLPNSPRLINVSRAADVMALLQECMPDVILLDLNLGDASGWDVLAEIRRHWSNRELPVIVVTAMDRFGAPALQSYEMRISRAATFTQRETVLCLQNILEAVLE
ncbi:MAG: hybrid sensor histidine kinase/response regulator [Anaerolineae bacterium]|nr:ATP-binding protein [Thermoflexales bacterium]MDW8406438.1 hybrid sensor histidine kinase/response regulator [Anaerolineae bacterium]